MKNDQLSRRGMLKAAGAVGVASVSAKANAAAMLGRPAAHRVEAKDFAGEVGANFRAFLADGAAVDLKLSEVKPLPSRGPRPTALPRRQAFVVVFDARVEIANEDRMVRVKNSRLGELDLLLQPAGSGARLEAIFN